jgi:hypothetical protein
MAKLVRPKELTKFRKSLEEHVKKFLADFEFHDLENPFRVGDWVKIEHDLKDDYGEVWDQAGEVLQVRRIAKDGEGLMFGSDLGIHWTCVQRADKPKE